MIDHLPVQKILSGLLWGVVYLGIASTATLAQDSTTKESTVQDSTTKDSSQTKLALVPVLGASPEAGFSIALLGVLNFKTDKKYRKERLSNIMPFSSFSFSGQVSVGSLYRIFTKNNRYLLQGRIVYHLGPSVFYGIGNNLPEANRENLKNRIFNFETRVLRKIGQNFFVGLQYQYVHLNNVEREMGGLLETTQVAGFDGSVVSGIGSSVIYDSRENALNSRKGFYAEFASFRHYQGLGSQYEFASFRLDIRKYFRLFPKSDHTLAIQSFGSFVKGNPPYTQLSALGGGTIMRGYIRGRYREKNYMALQAEYRFPVWKKWGLVAFGGVGDVYNKVTNFNSADLKGSYGLGIRFSILRATRTNIRLDYGRGSDGSSGVYLGIGEAF